MTGVREGRDSGPCRGSERALGLGLDTVTTHPARRRRGPTHPRAAHRTGVSRLGKGRGHSPRPAILLGAPRWAGCAVDSEKGWVRSNDDSNPRDRPRAGCGPTRPVARTASAMPLRYTRPRALCHRGGALQPSRGAASPRTGRRRWRRRRRRAACLDGDCALCAALREACDRDEGAVRGHRRVSTPARPPTRAPKCPRLASRVGGPLPRVAGSSCSR